MFDIFREKKLSIIEQVAKNKGVSVEEVMSEIQKSIDEAAKNPTEEFKKAFGDRVPSGEEFIKFTASKASEKMDK